MTGCMKGLSIVVLTLAASAGFAQTAPPPPGPAAAPPAGPTSPPPAEPTLDELLGLSRPKEAEKPGDAITGELERQLSEREVDEGFAQAVELMGQTATRLDGKDTGLDTQRLQQQTLLKLDTLIAEAQRQSQQSRQKQKQKREQDQAEGQQQQQQQSSQSGQQQQQQQDAGNQAGNAGVPLQEGQTNAPRAGSSASWGNLPEHVRKSLTQGRSDRFSSVYRQLTEQYYRRLAEEPKPAGAPR